MRTSSLVKLTRYEFKLLRRYVELAINMFQFIYFFIGQRRVAMADSDSKITIAHQYIEIMSSLSPQRGLLMWIQLQYLLKIG